MVKKRKTKARSARKPRGGKWLGWSFKLLLALILTAGAIFAAWYFFPKTPPKPQKGMSLAAVESLLQAAGLDLEQHRQVGENDGKTLWKISLKSETQRDGLVSGLRHWVHANHWKWHETKETRHNGESVRVIDLDTAPDKPLRLLLTVPAPPEKPPLENPAKPMVAIILDDIGLESVAPLKPVLDLNLPLTFAVLPFQPNSAEDAIYFHQHQYEIMLHMPMEPNNYPKNNPGKGAILSHFNDRQIRNAVQKALKTVPFASGVNNHMGSKVTASRALMQVVLHEVKGGDLYFIDSRTHPSTVAYQVARELGLRTAKRDVFLDTEASYEFTLRQLQEVRTTAGATGMAIAIGHPYPTTLRALAEEMPKMDRQGFRFVFVSEIVASLNDHL